MEEGMLQWKFSSELHELLDVSGVTAQNLPF